MDCYSAFAVGVVAVDNYYVVDEVIVLVGALGGCDVLGRIAVVVVPVVWYFQGNDDQSHYNTHLDGVEANLQNSSSCHLAVCFHDLGT